MKQFDFDKTNKHTSGDLVNNLGHRIDRHEDVDNITLIDDEMVDLLDDLNIHTLDDIISIGAINIYKNMKAQSGYFPTLEYLYLMWNIERGVISTFINKEHQEMLSLKALR